MILVAFFPNEERIAVAEEFGVAIVEAERKFPMIIHQKLSRVIAKEIFKIEDEEILNAICCHTTLRKHATKMDLVLFVADKIEWDQKGTPPYLIEIKKELGKSLEKSSFCIYFIFVGKERYIESYTSVARRSILGFKKNCTVERTRKCN